MSVVNARSCGSQARPHSAPRQSLLCSNHLLQSRVAPLGLSIAPAAFSEQLSLLAVSHVLHQHRRATAPLILRAGRTDTPSTSSSSSPSAQAQTTARDAIEAGDQLFKASQRYADAIKLYERALELNPTEDEARAALYNTGCAHAKLKQWTPASQAIVRAINDYRLKLVVALKDDDLKDLRDRREWLDALTEVKGGLSRAAKVDLRTEAKAPFRFARIILFGGLAAGAGLGLIIITGRLIGALKGGEGAPDLQETLQNFGINSAALAVLGFFLYRDLSTKQKAINITTREEGLGRLQLDLGVDRQLPLVKFRGQLRPVVIAGPKLQVEAAIRASEAQQLALRNRGVSVIPLYTDVADAPAAGKPKNADDVEARIRALKKEFRAADASSKGFASGSDKKTHAATTAGMAEADSAPASDSKGWNPAVGPVKEADKKWRLSAYDVAEWKAWVEEQRELAKIPPFEKTVWIQIQLDGTVRSSGAATPPWGKFLDDLPPLDDVRTTFIDGIGPSE